MPIPVLVAAQERREAHGAVRYHIEGDLVPVLHLELETAPVYFDHYVLLWKEPTVQVGLKPNTKHLRRTRSGAPVYLTEAKGPGHIALGRNGAGHALTIPLQAGETIEVREHQFIAATDNLDYSCTRMKGPATILFGGTSFQIDTFTCQQSDGIVWVHGYGDIFEVTLKGGEQLDIEPGGWIYKDHSVSLQSIEHRLATALVGGEQIAWHRFTGPGRVGLQSMYLHQTFNVQQIEKWAKYE